MWINKLKTFETKLGKLNGRRNMNEVGIRMRDGRLWRY